MVSLQINCDLISKTFELIFKFYLTWQILTMMYSHYYLYQKVNTLQYIFYTEIANMSIDKEQMINNYIDANYIDANYIDDNYIITTITNETVKDYCAFVLYYLFVLICWMYGFLSTRFLDLWNRIFTNNININQPVILLITNDQIANMFLIFNINVLFWLVCFVIIVLDKFGFNNNYMIVNQYITIFVLVNILSILFNYLISTKIINYHYLIIVLTFLFIIADISSHLQIYKIDQSDLII